MAAVSTQQLATIADLEGGPTTAAFVRAFAMFDASTKNAFLRRASGQVLATYKTRMTLPLVTWGDFTIGLVVKLARYDLITARGYNAKDPADVAIRAACDDAQKTLASMSDLKATAPIFDPDVVDSTPDVSENGPLASTQTSPFWRSRLRACETQDERGDCE